VAGDALSGFQGGYCYTHYQVSISRTIQSFTFDVTYYDSSSDCESECGGPILLNEGVCTLGAVFTLSRIESHESIDEGWWRCFAAKLLLARLRWADVSVT
jgi:hypothetical protein